jgi:8-amino-7-oxononanoate synthase
MSQRFIDTFVTPELDRLSAQGLARAIPDLDRGADRYLTIQGQRLLNLASNNYLGLAGHPDLARAASEAALAQGTSSGASRLVTGSSPLQAELEAEVARFKGCQAALTLTSGYAANLAALTTLADRHTVVFADKLNHASIVDGVLLSGARHARFRHNDLDHLSRLLAEHRDVPRKVLVTDTVFSMDGDRADLAGIVSRCRDHGVFIVVDEAHATGVLGQGRGLAAELGVEGEIGLSMGTFSKALGSLGGYLAGRREVVDLLTSRARSFIYTTALPPAVAAASLAGLRHVAAHPGLGTGLLAMSREFDARLRAMGFSTGDSSTQIIPVILGGNAQALAAREFLLRRGVYAPAIRPPTVPAGTARLRLSLRADLTPEDLDLALAALAELARERGTADGTADGTPGQNPGEARP